MKQFKLLISLLALLSISCLSAADPPALAKIGEKAPDFTLTSADNKPVSLSDFKGKDIVLIFSRAHW